VSPADRPAALSAAIALFNEGKYLAAHECLDDLWEATEGSEADFYKGLIQAAIALHHFQTGNLEGAAKLYSGHRRFLAAYTPEHAGLDLAAFLADVQRFLRPILARGPEEAVRFEHASRPRLVDSE